MRGIILVCSLSLILRKLESTRKSSLYHVYNHSELKRSYKSKFNPDVEGQASDSCYLFEKVLTWRYEDFHLRHIVITSSHWKLDDEISWRRSSRRAVDEADFASRWSVRIRPTHWVGSSHGSNYCGVWIGHANYEIGHSLCWRKRQHLFWDTEWNPKPIMRTPWNHPFNWQI